MAFLPAVQYDTNRYSKFVALGDLNADGIPDLVTTNYFAADQRGISGAGGFPAPDGGSASVFLSATSSGYAPARQYGVGYRPTSAAIGDLNDDGLPDVAVTNQDGTSVLLNDGTGALSAPVTYATGTSPQWVAIADLNGDSRGDLAVANRGSSPTDAGVTVLLNIGNGSFSATSYPAGTAPIHLAVGDLDSDSRPDLVVSSGSSVYVLTNLERGRFGPAAGYGAGTNPLSAAIGDLNADGRPDLAVGRRGGGAGVLLNVGDGVFAAAIVYAIPSSHVAIGDLNRDGKPDLVSVATSVSQLDGDWTRTSPCGVVSFLSNAGNGTFGSSASIGVSPEPLYVTVGDANRDGKADLIVPNADGVSLLLNAAP